MYLLPQGSNEFFVENISFFVLCWKQFKTSTRIDDAILCWLEEDVTCFESDGLYESGRRLRSLSKMVRVRHGNSFKLCF